MKNRNQKEKEPQDDNEVLDERLLNKIKNKSLEIINAELEDYYIPLKGGKLDSTDSEKEDLEGLVRENFLKSDKKICVLLGESGTGKTWFGLHLVRQLWEDYEIGGRIPLWISLNEKHQHIRKLLPHFLKKEIKIQKDEIQVIKDKHCRLLLVLDGYDLLRGQPPLYIRNKWHNKKEWPMDIKVLITCRHEVLTGVFKKNLFRSGFGGSEPLVCVIKKLDEDQIGNIVREYVKNKKGKMIQKTNSPIKLKEKKHKATRKGKEKITEPEVKNLWKVGEYLQAINKMQELKTFIEKPFVLLKVLEKITLIIGKSAKEMTAQDLKLNEQIICYQVYEYFLRCHIEREANRLINSDADRASLLLEAIEKNQVLSRFGEDSRRREKSRKEKGPRKLEEVFRNYIQQFALRMYQRGCSVVHWSEHHSIRSAQFSSESVDVNRGSVSQISQEEIERDQWAEAFLNIAGYPFKKNYKDEYFLLRYLRNACPLRRVGAHSWSFTSEPLVEHIILGQLRNSALTKIWAEFGCNINRINLQNEIKTLRFLVEQVRKVERLETLLFEVIEASRMAPDNWRAAANASTILNYAGVSFTGRDWCEVRLGGEEKNALGWGADLSNAVLDSVDLSRAVCCHVIFKQAWMRNVNLSEAILDGAVFGEWPYLRINSEINACAYSPDGKEIAVAGIDVDRRWRVIIYNAKTQKPQKYLQISCAIKAINALAYHPENHYLALGNQDSTVRLWPLTSGKSFYTFQGHTDTVTSLVYDSKGKQLASGSRDNTVRLWSEKKMLYLLRGHQDDVTSVAYHPKEQLLASSSQDNTIRIWKSDNGDCVDVLLGHTWPVLDIAFHPDGKQLASASSSGSIRLWDETGKTSTILKGHRGAVTSVAYHPVKRQLASGGADWTVRFWNLEAGCCEFVLRNEAAVMSIVYCQDERNNRLAARNADGSVQIWNTKSTPYNQMSLNNGHKGEVLCVTFNPKKQPLQLCSAGDDGTICLWSADKGSVKNVLKKHKKRVVCVTYNPKGNKLLSGSKDNTIRLWSVENGLCVQKFKSEADHIWSLAFHPRGHQFACGRKDGTLEIWQMKREKYLEKVLVGHTKREKYLEKVLGGHTKGVSSVVYHPNGKQLASGSHDCTVRLWSIDQGYCEHVLKGHTKSVRVIVYHPDGYQLASGSNDGTIRLWEVASGVCEKVLHEHVSAVACIAYHPQGCYMASSGHDHTVRLSIVSTGICLSVIKTNDIVYSLAWSPDGNRLATGGRDNAVRLWCVNINRNRVTYELIWQRGCSFLNTEYLNITQVMGLNDRPLLLQLLKERSEELCTTTQKLISTLKGYPSKKSSAQKLLAEHMKKRVYVPKGYIKFIIDGGNTIHIDRERWFLAMVKKEGSPHVWLLRYGLTSSFYTDIQAFHFYRDKSRPTFFNESLGIGLIKVESLSPFDLKNKVNNWKMKAWTISKRQAVQLRGNVLQDQSSRLGYWLLGRTGQATFRKLNFLAAYNCASWCEKHLIEIGKEVLPTKRWINFFVAIPSSYLPTEEVTRELSTRSRRKLGCAKIVDSA